MRVNRTLLYWGTFLVAIGGIVVATDLGALDVPVLADALRLWPVAVIAVGLGLMLRRTSLGLSGGMLAAAVPGVILGSAFAIMPRFAGDCGSREPAAAVASESGTFDDRAAVSLSGGCGSISIATRDGSDWSFDAGNSQGIAPAVSAGPTRLRIASGTERGWDALGDGRDDWQLTLPTSELASLEAEVNAGRAEADLAGADIDRLSLTANLSDVTVDASGAAIDAIVADIHLGRLSLVLPASANTRATIEVGGGGVRICVPDGLGLRVEVIGDASEVEVADLEPGRPRFRLDDTSIWVSADYGTATHRADVLVTADFATVEINPTGGCK